MNTACVAGFCEKRKASSQSREHTSERAAWEESSSSGSFGNLVITFHDELALVAVNRTVAVRRQKIQLGSARRQSTAIAVLCNCWNADCVDVA